MNRFLFLLCAIAIVASTASADFSPLSGRAWGGKLYPRQRAPVDPSLNSISIQGNRNNGLIHIHLWGPNTTSVTEYNVTALGNNAFDYDLFLNVDNGIVTLDHYVNNPGPYNNGVVKAVNVTGTWDRIRNQETLNIRLFTNLRTERVQGGALRIAEVELKTVITGLVVRQFGSVKLENGKISSVGPAFLNLPASIVPSPYQYNTAYGDIDTQGISVVVAYRALSSSKQPLTSPVDPYLAIASIREAYFNGNVLCGIADFYTVAPEGFQPLSIINATFSAITSSITQAPGMYLLESVDIQSGVDDRYYGEYFNAFL